MIIESLFFGLVMLFFNLVLIGWLFGCGGGAGCDGWEGSLFYVSETRVGKDGWVSIIEDEICGDKGGVGHDVWPVAVIGTSIGFEVLQEPLFVLPL